MSPKENEELVRYRFEKAKETFVEAEVQLKNEFWNLAVNRLYYACFYAVSALLASKEIYAKTHSGTKQMFGQHFVKNGTIDQKSSDFYTKIFSLRQSGDYQDFCDYEKPDVMELIAPAKDLINKIEAVLYKK